MGVAMAKCGFGKPGIKVFAGLLALLASLLVLPQTTEGKLAKLYEVALSGAPLPIRVVVVSPSQQFAIQLREAAHARNISARVRFVSASDAAEFDTGGEWDDAEDAADLQYEYFKEQFGFLDDMWSRFDDHFLMLDLLEWTLKNRDAFRDTPSIEYSRYGARMVGRPMPNSSSWGNHSITGQQWIQLANPSIETLNDYVGGLIVGAYAYSVYQTSGLTLYLYPVVFEHVKPSVERLIEFILKKSIAIAGDWYEREMVLLRQKQHDHYLRYLDRLKRLNSPAGIYSGSREPVLIPGKK